MLRILGRTSSINVRKVLWTAQELRLDIAHEDQWATQAAPSTSPEFLALNPNGLVPVIEDETGVLWESNTICRYLAAKSGRLDLLPATPFARAEVERWMDWQAGELNTAWRYAFLALVRRAPGYDDKRRIEKSVRNWNRLIGLIDGQINVTGAYITGPFFTLADVVLGLSINRWRCTPMEHAAVPAVEAYFERLCERAAGKLYASLKYP